MNIISISDTEFSVDCLTNCVRHNFGWGQAGCSIFGISQFAILQITKNKNQP